MLMGVRWTLCLICLLSACGESTPASTEAPSEDASLVFETAFAGRSVSARSGALDAGPGPTDAGTASTDAGTAPTDAGPVSTDAGWASTDAGPADGSMDPDPDERFSDVLWFEDVTVESGIDLDRVPTNDYFSMPDRMSGGVCVLDVDGTPPLDLFFAVRPSPDGPSSRLYVGDGPLSYLDETTARGLGDVGDAFGCLAFDEDGDGDDDLLVTGFGLLSLYINEGGTFVAETERLSIPVDPLGMYMSAAAGDVDGDLDLDIYVAGFQHYDPDAYAIDEDCGSVPCRIAIHAHPFIEDLLLIRDSVGDYQNRAAELAPDLMALEPGLCAGIADLDGDHIPDIYVGNDGGVIFWDHVLKRNSAGHFDDIAEYVGLAYNAFGSGGDTMGWTTADIDGNGSLDHVATSFEQDPTAVFLCDAGSCEERGLEYGTRELILTFRWAAALLDIELDGDPDLVEATGHFFSDSEVTMWGLAAGATQPANLLLNDDGARFQIPVLDVQDGLHVPRAGRGMAVVDLDDDGRPDLVMATATGKPALLHNIRRRQGHFLQINLVGRAPNTPAVGAWVEVRSNGRTFVRQRRIGEGYLGNFDPRLHFGLPAGSTAAEILVRWPDGTLFTRSGVELDQEITILEP